MNTARLGSVTVDIGPDWTVTRIGALSVAAAPEDSPAYALLARQLGYGSDTARLCVDHELMHSAPSHWLGLEASPTLARVAVCPDAPATDVTRLEECAVLAVQAFARAVGVDLVGLLCGTSGDGL